MGESGRRSDVRVASVRLDGFRGVPGIAEIVLGNGNKPTSAVIFGANGSGKSSIVDAVEWACQGRIGRTPIGRSPASTSVVNLHAPQGCAKVEVILSDDRHLRRRAWGDEVRGDTVLECFQRVPMSLKRADILRFLDTSPSHRGTVLLDYSLDARPAGQAIVNHEQYLREELLEAKRATRSLASLLAARLGVEPPTSATEIKVMISEHVFKGLPEGLRAHANLPRKIQEHLHEIERAGSRVAALTTEIKAVRKQVSGPLPTRLKAMHDIIGDVSHWLTEAFLDVTRASYVARVETTFGESSDVGIDLWVHLVNGARRTPQQVFSEGYQDLLSLLYYLSLMRAAGQRGQARVLILDDVLQSVDAEIRVALMYLVAREFKDWQLLITVHDRLWRTQLRDVFQRVGHPIAEIEIRGWHFAEGPRLQNDSFSDPAAALWRALEAEDPHTVCGIAGRVLEEVCERLSWTIPISVKRRRGDAYTLNDLWPGTLKELRTTTVASTASDIDRYVHLRNAAGAHYNEWAEGVAWSDAERLGWAVADLVGHAHCAVCHQWVDRRGVRTYACPCGKTAIVPRS